MSLIKPPKIQKLYTGGVLPDYIKDTDLPLLGSSAPVVVENGDWTKYLVEYETQKKRNVDPYACVSYSALTCLEMYANAQGIDINKSDKFTAVMSGTIPYRGNNFRKVAESIKKDWTVDEELYPFTDTSVEDYYKPVPEQIKKIALQDKPNWRYFYRFPTTAHALGQDNRKRDEVIMDALRYAPLQVSIKYPRNKPVRGIYRPEYGQNHAVVLYNYIEGKEWHIFDSYDPLDNGGFKRLHWDYPVYGVMAHTLEHVATDKDIILRDYRGKLIKNENSPKVYYVDKMGIEIAWIENEQKFNFNHRQGWHGSWDKIETIKIPIQEDFIY